MCVLLLHGIGGVVDTISTGFSSLALQIASQTHSDLELRNCKGNFMTCFVQYRAVGAGGMIPPYFGRSVSPRSTREPHYAHHSGGQSSKPTL